MLVQCHNNRLDALDENTFIARNRYRHYGKDMEELDIEPHATYVVYAVRVEESESWYYIADGNFSALGYPVAYPSVFFELVDERESRCWTSIQTKMKDGHAARFMSFKEWTTNGDFYEHLVCGDSKERRIFFDYKERMDLEFPNILKYAPIEYVHENFCQCGKCENVWENPLSLTGMLRCPKCGEVYVDTHWKLT